MGFGTLVDRMQKIGGKLKRSIGRRSRRDTGATVHLFNNLNQEDRCNDSNTSEAYGVFFQERTAVSSTPSKSKHQDNLLKKSNNTTIKPTNSENAVRNDNTVNDATGSPATVENKFASKPSNATSTTDYTVRVIIHEPVLLPTKVVEVPSLKTPDVGYMPPIYHPVVPRNANSTRQMFPPRIETPKIESQDSSHIEPVACTSNYGKDGVQNLLKVSENKTKEAKTETPDKTAVNPFERRPSETWKKLNRKQIFSSRIEKPTEPQTAPVQYSSKTESAAGNPAKDYFQNLPKVSEHNTKEAKTETPEKLVVNPFERRPFETRKKLNSQHILSPRIEKPTEPQTAPLQYSVQTEHGNLKQAKDSFQNLAEVSEHNTKETKLETSEKFVVNLFESRPSRRWKKSKISKPVNNDIEILSCGYKEFVKYRQQRDVECSKMAQASKLLEAIKKAGNRDWIDQLLVEKMLLESDEKINLLNRKIVDLNASLPGSSDKHLATVKLSDFKFFLESRNTTNEKYTDFYVLTLSYGTHLAVSGFFTAIDDSVTFPEIFTVENVIPAFGISVKLFSIRLKTSGTKKKTCVCCPRSKLIFKDINTAELEERTVLKSSFKLRGEAIITKKHIKDPSLLLNTDSGDLKANANFAIKLDSLNMEANVSGMLNFGRKINDFVFWENKWCSLKGTHLSVYNDPNSSTSAIAIDLSYCLKKAGRDEHCPKKRSFVVTIGHPPEASDASTLMKDYYFAAITNKDYKKWVNSINSIWDGLNEWQN